VGSRRPEKIAGLNYLDAANSYAFAFGPLFGPGPAPPRRSCRRLRLPLLSIVSTSLYSARDSVTFGVATLNLNCGRPSYRPPMDTSVSPVFSLSFARRSWVGHRPTRTSPCRSSRFTLRP